jgi:hypothetical protein
MLRRALHPRLALLAFVAAMLLVVMPTVTPVLAPADAAHAMRKDAGADDAVAHAHHGMSGGSDHRGQGRDRGYSHAHGHDSDHDGAACAYCPLLAGLVQWAPPPPWRVVPLPAITAPAFGASAPAACIQRDTLGARGPPVRVIA